MAIDDERDLRNRLSAALDQVPVPDPPVRAVLQGGKVLRVRRRIEIAVGLAAAVAAAVMIPSVIDQSAHRGPANRGHRPPKVTVARLSSRVAPGLIARGTAGKQSWRITFDRADKNSLCVLVAHDAPVCMSGTAPSVSGLATMTGLSGSTWNSFASPVGADVTNMSVSLSDGAVLNLHPFGSAGYRWVGLVVPRTLRIVEAIAYSGKRELGYSVPFTHDGYQTLVTWLRPGQVGPARSTRLIGSGVAAAAHWSVVGYAGPWGYCEVLTAQNGHGSSCQQAGVGYPGSELIGPASATLGRWVVGTARPDVAYLVLTLRNRATLRVPVVEFAGSNWFALAINTHPRIVSWRAYDDAGHRLYGGPGWPYRHRR
jgi:hypothetical protein